MLFARRTPLTALKRAQAMVWPTGDYMRSTRYLWLRARRIAASPHKLAFGLAIGVFVATTPLLGLQLMLAIGLAWTLRGSVPAAIIGTFWANPITSPPVWLASYGVGAFVLGRDPFLEGRGVAEALAQVSAQIGQLTFKVNREALGALYDTILPVLKPVLIGSLPLGLLFGALTYAIMHRVALRLPRRYSHLAT
jgi:uncharacterized protein